MVQGPDRDWLRPEIHPEAVPAGGGGGPALFELRPLSLGEILDRSFALYRSRFWLFASIAAVSASVQVVVQGISLATAHKLMRFAVLQGPAGGSAAAPPFSLQSLIGMELGTWAAALVFFLVAAVTQAATTLAMSEVYLNRPASAKASLVFALRRWYRWIGIALWQVGSMIWIPLLGLTLAALLAAFGARTNSPALTVLGAVLIFVAILGGFPAGFILYLRNTLAGPAAVVERLKIRAAMRRSKVLAAGTKGRLFVVLLIAGCLYLVVGVLESPATLLIMFAPKEQHYLAQALTLVLSFVGHTVVAPVALIGLTLVYFDQRVRKEALDLQLLLEGSRGGAAHPVPVTAGSPPETSAPAAGGFAPLG